MITTNKGWRKNAQLNIQVRKYSFSKKVIFKPSSENVTIKTDENPKRQPPLTPHFTLEATKESEFLMRDWKTQKSSHVNLKWCWSGITVCTQINGNMGHNWCDAMMQSSGRSFLTLIVSFSWLFFFFFWPICHCSGCRGVRASEAVGIRALSDISMGNNQMDQSSDSRDLFLPTVYQIYLTPLCPLLSIFQFFNFFWSKLCPFVCALSCLIEDWWGWILNVVHRFAQEEGEMLPLLILGAKTSMWIWQHHLSKSTEVTSWH